MKNREINIDYLYLDNETCTRCMDTEKSLENALEDVGKLLKASGYEVNLTKEKMDSREKAIQYRFSLSPTIRVNNADLGFEQTENNCSDCGELCGCGEDTSCRTWLIDGKEYEVPPRELFIDRILKAIYGEKQMNEIAYSLPENLHNYYEGIRQKNRKETQCCDSTCCQ